MNNIVNKKDSKTIMIVVLASLIFFIEIITLSVAYFDQSKKAGGEIRLGELDFNILTEISNSNEILPGDDVEMKISVQNYAQNKQNLVPFYFRFKILNNDEEYDKDLITFFDENDFIYSNGYYYFKQKLEFNKICKLTKSIKISPELSQKQSEEFDLKILVDAVQSEYGAYKDVFFDAPQEWISIIENG